MEEKKTDNLHIYDIARKIPAHALKEIKAGRLKGMSDINPMYRIKKMTGLFGPCGIGWKYEIVKEWLESYGNEVKAFLNINLYYKWNGEWSEPIPGTGGSSFVSQERNGTFVNDECWKMALTYAISVATKALGVAADVYYNADSKIKIKSDSKYEQGTNATQNSKAPSNANGKNGDAVKQRAALAQKFPDVFAAKTIDELMAVYNNHADLQGDSEFMLAMSIKKKFILAMSTRKEEIL
jgi:hypothetical protein